MIQGYSGLCEEIISTCNHAGVKICRCSCRQNASYGYTDTHVRTIQLFLSLNGNLKKKKKWMRERCIKRNQCNFSQGVLTPSDVRCNRAKQGLCTVIHMVCGFMRGQMVPLKQEVIDIMTWPSVEWVCMCVWCVCACGCWDIPPIGGQISLPTTHYCWYVNISSDS